MDNLGGARNPNGGSNRRGSTSPRSCHFAADRLSRSRDLGKYSSFHVLRFRSTTTARLEAAVLSSSFASLPCADLDSTFAWQVVAMEATLTVVVVEVSAQMEAMEVLMAMELEVLVALGDAELMDLEALEALVEVVGVLVDHVGQEGMELVVMGLVMAVVALGMVAMVALVVPVVQMAAATVAVDMAAQEALHSQVVRWILVHQQEDIPSMAKVEKLMALAQRVEEDMDPVELMAMDPVAMDPVELMAMDLVEPMDRVDQVELMDQGDMEMDLELVVMAAVWAMDLVAKVEKASSLGFAELFSLPLFRPQEGAKATCPSKLSPERPES